MDNLVFCHAPDIENIIANDLREFFISDVKFNELFPNDQIKVSTDHPFVQLMNQEISEGEKYDLSAFPSVTVVDTNFSKLIETPVVPQAIKVKKAILDEIKTGGRDQFIMSKQALLSLEAAFSEKEELSGEGYETFRKTQIAIEIWAGNNLLKGKIFDLVSLYLIGSRRFNLHNNKNTTIEEETITGERSGIYNFDFGEILYGGIIRFDVGYKVGFYSLKDMILGGGISIQNNSII